MRETRDQIRNWLPSSTLAVFSCQLFCFALIGCLAPAAIAEQVVVVVLDDSGSMNDSFQTNQGYVVKMDAAKRALTQVVQSLPADTKLGITLLNGNETGKQLVPLGILDLERVVSKIENVRADGGTPLGESMREATDELLQFRQKERYGLYRLLIITDGEANDPANVAMYLPMILSRGISVDVIGVDMPGDHQLAQYAHSYRKADDQQALVQALQEVLAEQPDDQNVDDFSLLDGLPDEVAVSAIETLAQPSNEALWQHPLDNELSTQLPSVPTTTISFNTGASGLSCCSIFPCMVFGVVFLIVLRVLNKKPRR